MIHSFETLEPFDESGDLNVIIDTPKGSRNKYSYNKKCGLFELAGVQPAGMFFPFDFGFVPQTKGEDGDALDVLVLMDEPAFVGCLIQARAIGVIEARQTEKRRTIRNDRVIAVPCNSRNQDDITKLSDLNTNLLREIEHFFISYNEMKGKKFRPIGHFGPDRALRLIKESAQ
jgi:inorganic pyrophosphatase